jgi:glycosyltransferase involved in cell wall biosynthesis
MHSPLQVSVVLCAYNPRLDLLEIALRSIESQTLPRSQFELIVVDNNSAPPVPTPNVPSLSVSVVRESRQGLIHARLAGIAAGQGELVVFVDDDNELATNYLEEAVAFAHRHPVVGVFSGSSEGVFEKVPLISHEPRFGPWDPIGAGMVSRREVAKAYLEFVSSHTGASSLGRTGHALFSCEDTLMARIGNREGYACAYAPALRLRHHIKRERLAPPYLFALIRDLGRSYVRLERLMNSDAGAKRFGIAELILRLFYRISREGVTGLFRWAWDLGYFIESHMPA